MRFQVMTETAQEAPQAAKPSTRPAPSEAVKLFLQGCERAHAAAVECRDRHDTWEGAAAEMGVTSATLHRFVVEGYQPRDPIIRHKLGLPAMTDKIAFELAEYVVAL